MTPLEATLTAYLIAALVLSIALALWNSILRIRLQRLDTEQKAIRIVDIRWDDVITHWEARDGEWKGYGGATEVVTLTASGRQAKKVQTAFRQEWEKNNG